MSALFDQIRTKRKERFDIAERANKLLSDTDGPLEGEALSKWEAMHEDIDNRKAEIDILERQYKLQCEFDEDDARDDERRGTPATGLQRDERAISGEVYSRMLRDFASPNKHVFDADERAMMPDAGFELGGNEFTFDLGTGAQIAAIAERVASMPGRAVEQVAAALNDQEMRALGTTSGPVGGNTVAVDNRLMRFIEIAMLHWSPLRNFVTIIRTDTGADMPHPTTNDTSEEGEILAENTQVNEGDPAFGQIVFKSAMLHSKLVRVSIQLMDDSAIDMAAHLGGQLGMRLGRGSNNYYTTGTGTAQPEGYVTAAPQGRVSETAAGLVLTYDDFVALEHSVNPNYRNMGASFGMSDPALQASKSIKDAEGRPLWRAGLSETDPDTILGYPYFVNTHMDGMGTSKKPICFGAFRKHYVREVRGIRTQVLRERYADFLQVAFQSFLRIDSRLVDAGTNPLKHLATPAA